VKRIPLEFQKDAKREDFGLVVDGGGATLLDSTYNQYVIVIT